MLFSLYHGAYTGLPRNAWLLSLVQFINRSGSMVLFFLTLYLTRKLGFSLVQAGQVVGAYGFGSLLSAPGWAASSATGWVPPPCSG